MESSSQDRHLPATERKLQKAREQGQIARSKDLTHFAALAAGGAALWWLSGYAAAQLKATVTGHLRFDAQTLLHPHTMLLQLQDATWLGLSVVIPIALLVMAAAVAAILAAGGWNLSLTPITPDFSRTNPLSGLGRLFSKEHAMEMLKLVLITVLLISVASVFFIGHFHEMADLSKQPSPAALQRMMQWLLGGLGLLLLVLGMVALIDLPLQKFLHQSRLKMSLEEVKQEHKETEGNPQIKGRLRSKQREIAQRKSVTAVPKADFVVMNPTHYAVAVRYDDQKMNAPQVIAKGADLLAFKIREMATRHSVPVLQSPKLARALYAHAELDRTIPASLYTAVAQVLAHTYRLKAALRGEAPMPGDCPEPLVPNELDPHHRTRPSH